MPAMTDQRPTRPDADSQNDLLFRFLATNDAYCEQCGYALRGLTESSLDASQLPKCPECGVHLAMKVGILQPPFGSWVLALASFCLAAGFDSIVTGALTCSLIYNAFIGGRLPPFIQAAVVYGVFLALTISSLTGIFLMIRKRERWFRMKPSTRWPRAWAIFVAVGLVHALWGLFLFLRG